MAATTDLPVLLRLVTPSQAQLIVLAAWVAVGLALVGIGLLVRRVLGLRGERAAGGLLDAFWLGWSGLVAALQVWHLLLPVDGRGTAFGAVLGLVGLLTGGVEPWRAALRRVPRNAPALVACALAAIWLSNHALSGARYGDSGAYFIPTVKWLREYAIVPGLGNLHAHLGFNQSYFAYVAALDAGPFASRPYHVANGLLVLALVCQVLLATWTVLARPAAARARDVFLVFTLPAVLPLGLSIFVTSPAPDMAVFALGIVASAELVALATARPASGTAHLRAIALLTCAAVTSKQTFGGFAAGLLLVAPLLWLGRERPRVGDGVRELAIFAAVVAAVVVPWLGRSVLLTGCPLFPSMAIVLPVDWRVRTDIEGWFRNAVYVGGFGVIVNDPRWFLRQLEHWGWNAPEVLAPLAVAAAALVLGLLRMILGGRDRARAPSFAIVLPALASLAFSIVNNPVLRYAGSTVWALAASALAFALADVVLRRGIWLRAGVVALAAWSTVLAGRAGFDPLWLPLRDFEHHSPVRWEARTLETGLTLNVPLQTEACWNAPLPCTPFPNPALGLRRAGDLQGGFAVDPDLHARYQYDPGKPFQRQVGGAP